MTGYLIGCALPVAEFGRLRFPPTRLRFRDGWIRVGKSRDGQRILCTLVDKEDRLLYAATPLEANLKSERLGTALQHFLMDYNRFEPGEHPGDVTQVLVGT